MEAYNYITNTNDCDEMVISIYNWRRILGVELGNYNLSNVFSLYNKLHKYDRYGVLEHNIYLVTPLIQNVDVIEIGVHTHTMSNR